MVNRKKIAMNPYDVLKTYTDEYYSNQSKENGKAVFSKAIELLQNQDTSLRPGTHKIVDKTFSIPASKKNCFVLGIRYKKPNGTYTEDHFLFEEGETEIKKGNGKKKWLEKLLPEYKGSHKLQIVEK
jgi:hypothetical protein